MANIALCSARKADMKIQLTAYGIAKEILNGRQMDFDLPEGSSLSTMKEILTSKFPEFEKLASLRFAVGEEYEFDHYILKEGEEVVIIPPVSGG
jgi:molybdopterin converting factor small subunit